MFASAAATREQKFPQRRTSKSLTQFTRSAAHRSLKVASQAWAQSMVCHHKRRARRT